MERTNANPAPQLVPDPDELQDAVETVAAALAGDDSIPWPKRLVILAQLERLQARPKKKRRPTPRRRFLESGVPELQEAVDKEEVSRTLADEIAAKPPDKQRELLRRVARERRRGRRLAIVRNSTTPIRAAVATRLSESDIEALRSLRNHSASGGAQVRAGAKVLERIVPGLAAA